MVPGLGRFPGGGNGSPLQYSRLKNPMDRGDWWATVCRVAKNAPPPVNSFCASGLPSNVPSSCNFSGTLGRGCISVSCLQKDVPWSSVGHVTEALPHVQGLMQCPAHSRHINPGKGFPVGTSVKESTANSGDARDTGSISGLGRPPGRGNDTPLQYSCLEIFMGRGA